MCYRTKLTKNIADIQSKFEGQLEIVPDIFPLQEEINGFDKPLGPIILLHDNQLVMQIAAWGYKVDWQPAPLLNATFENKEKKQSFSSHINNLCLIPVNGFYEWKWLDQKGQRKNKYLMHLPEDELFFLAGQYRLEESIDTINNKKEYVIYTQEAQGIMVEIHNSKRRMPYSLFSAGTAIDYLKGATVKADINFRTKNLEAQQSLF